MPNAQNNTIPAGRTFLSGLWRASGKTAAPRACKAAALFAILTLALADSAWAIDPEGCLVCHQFRGLSRLDKDGKQIRMFSIDPQFHNEAAGPHGRIRCTGCHVRAEVEVYPHKPVSPVDCTRTCHLSSTRNVEVRFAHDKLAGGLKTSVHSDQVLAKSNELLGSPLRPGQAKCLLCHDEPMFRKEGTNWAHREAPIQRCNVCHDEQLPIDARFNFWHVQARSKPARNNLDLVRVCSICHSNDKIRDHFKRGQEKMADASVSYLASFHGKATLLGNQEAASCLDCHVAESENVHVMHKHTDAAAPTHELNIANTCRSAACHPMAGENISSAAIHLDLSRSSGLEWIIAVVFVGMILGTFGPSMVITLLKLFHMAIGREDPDHHHELRLAQKLMADPEARAKLRRFNLHQRFQHWFLVLTFSTLVITGFPMKFASHGWAQWVIRTVGGLNNVRLIHRITGALLVGGFFYHSFYIINHMRKVRKRTGDSWFKIFFNLPLCMKPSDMKEMFSLLAWLMFLKKRRPDAGRFTAEEKFEYFGVFWGTMLLGVTGFIMWFNAEFSRWLPGRVLTVANLVHSFEAFLALLHVGILHLATVIFSPGVFPISPAMFTGDTPPAELAEAHSEMIHHVAREKGITVEAHHG